MRRGCDNGHTLSVSACHRMPPLCYPHIHTGPKRRGTLRMGNRVRARAKQPREKQPVVRVLKSGGQLHVWFCRDGEPTTLAGAVAVSLAADAWRYGQDLVGELIDKALWMADRRSTAASLRT